MPSAPVAVAPKKALKERVKLWVRLIQVVFQHAPILPVAFGVRVTADPDPVASPTIAQFGQD
jgi:hypothetical protein